MIPFRALASLIVLSALLAGCSEKVEPRAKSAGQPPAADEVTGPTDDPMETPDRAHALPAVIVHKNPSCGCCNGWVEHMRQAGFVVEVLDVENLHPVKTRVGLPSGMGSCHTAEVAGYFVEGHVPAEDVKRLLAERPAARGLALPGMPVGSPGMEDPSGRVQPYTVMLVKPDGTTRPFVRHND